MIEQYHQPKSIKEALEFKKEFGKDALFLSGGTEVNNKDFPLEPKHLIALGTLNLDKIEDKKGELHIGAHCTIQQLIESDNVPGTLKKAAQMIINKNIRNVATVGGHIASNKSCGDVLSALVALDAHVEIESLKGAETVSILDLVDEKKTGLITQIHISQKNQERHLANANFRRSANDVSIINASVSFHNNGDVLSDVIIALGGVAKHIVRLNAVEKELSGKAMPQREEIEKLVSENVDPITDIRGSAEFKKYQAGVMVAQAFCTAKERGQA